MARYFCLLKDGLLGLFFTLAFVFCSGQQATSAAGDEMPPAMVKTLTVQPRDIVPVYEYVGKTVGSLEVELRAQVGGILKKRNYREGDLVKKGDILFEIEPETYKANRDRAEAKKEQAAAVLENARRDWNRVQTLFAQNAVSQKDRDNSLARLNSASADHDAAIAAAREANIQLEYAYVKAPITGYASKERQTEGNLVSTAGEASILTELVCTDPVFVEFSLPNMDILNLRRLVDRGFATWGEKPEARVRFADGSQYEKTGELNFIDNKVDPVTSVVKARASFPNPENLLMPGQFVRVAVSGPVLTKALCVPRGAVIQTQQGSMVMVVDGNDTVSSRKIKILLARGEEYIVEEGLKAGERIVSEGIGKIRDGQKVQELPPAGNQDGGK